MPIVENASVQLDAGEALEAQITFERTSGIATVSAVEFQDIGIPFVLESRILTDKGDLSLIDWDGFLLRTQTATSYQSPHRTMRQYPVRTLAGNTHCYGKQANTLDSRLTANDDNLNRPLITGRRFTDYEEIGIWYDPGGNLRLMIMILPVDIFIAVGNEGGSVSMHSRSNFGNVQYIDETNFRKVGGDVGIRRIYGITPRRPDND